jgi:hypothetical protein
MKTKSLLRSLGLVGVLALSCTAARAVPIVGPNGHLYDVVFSGKITWTEADTAARALGHGWHLATISDAAENALIEGLRKLTGNSEIWLGGYQDPRTETSPSTGWTWVNNEGPIAYFNWPVGEPNDYFGPQSEQYLSLGRFNNEEWNDQGILEFITGYAVEREPVPDSITLLGALGSVVLVLACLRRPQRTSIPNFR